MKKVLTICFAILMVFSLFACSTNTAVSSASPSPSQTETSPSAPTENTDTSPKVTDVSAYDPNKDYKSRDPYKVVYLSFQTGSFGQMLDANFKGWASLLNLDYTHAEAQTMDDFYNQLEVYASQGYDGYILDGDSTTGARTIELTKELGITSWMTATAALKNPDGTMMWPAVTLDSEAIGRKQSQWLFDNYQKHFGTVDKKEIGYIYIDYSVIPNLHVAEVGAETLYKELFNDPNLERFFVADCAGDAFTADAAYNKVSPIMTSHADIKYWVIAANNELYGVGAARAQEALGFTSKNAITCSINGDSLFASWDTGYDGTWVCAIAAPNKIFTGIIMNSLVAMMDGIVTAETMWPEWVAEGNKYAEYKCPSTPCTKDNYKDFLAEVDKAAPYTIEQ